MDARVSLLACWLALAAPLALAAQDQPAARLAKRYGYAFDATLYPQKTPKEALQSLIKAFDSGRFEYLLAHLADPKFVDSRVSEYALLYKGREDSKALVAFERLARETAQHFREDPPLLRELRQFAKEAEWETQEGAAVGSLKTGSPRKVFMRNLEDRWFLENRQQ